MPDGRPADEAAGETEEALREIYREDYVAGYHQSAGTRLQQVVDRMDLGEEMQVVDFACGSGLLNDLIADRVAKYTGVDFSEEFIAAARQRQRRHQQQGHQGQQGGRAETRFVCQSIVDFCDENPATFDRAFAMDFTEHVPDPELVPILSAMRKSLRPDGRLYLHTPDGDFLLEILKSRGWMTQVDGHVAVRNRSENAQLMRDAGFRSVEVESLPHYLPALAWLHALRGTPVLGRYLGARVFIACRP